MQITSTQNACHATQVDHLTQSWSFHDGRIAVTVTRRHTQHSGLVHAVDRAYKNQNTAYACDKTFSEGHVKVYHIGISRQVLFLKITSDELTHGIAVLR